MHHVTFNKGLASRSPLGTASSGSLERRPRGRRVASLASGVVVAIAMAIVGTPALAAAAAPGAALDVLTATPPVANVGQTVLAQLAKSTVPAGDHVAKITLSWVTAPSP